MLDDYRDLFEHQAAEVPWSYDYEAIDEFGVLIPLDFE